MNNVNQHMPQAPLTCFFDSPTLTPLIETFFFCIISKVTVKSSLCGNCRDFVTTDLCRHPLWVDMEIGQFSDQ